MLSSDNLEKIKEEIKIFFKKMNFEVEIELLAQKNLTLPINLKMEDPQILIGEKGQTLFEIQHLLKIILNKKIKESFYIDLDISDYKKKKIEYLKELARSVADEVALTKKEKILFPMSAYERRIIHLEIAERSDVTSESLGKEPERRVVIRPYP
ncbi:MAG: R3H domain-containing nucleic acid-binding protein [Patescibacteria group bacterium]|nr:R3H domain-containing nucleic acid-binding protein [Patescibacteria group bacterium]